MTEPRSLADNRYLLVDRLGEGGMAKVWRAFDQRLQVWRAVKVLLPQYAKKSKIIKRFETEARTMALLEHKHIVRVYDVDRDGAFAYIVMELVEGGSLVDWLECHGPMPARLAIDCAVEVCLGISAAHAKGVIHRDIKPHNVMVDRQGVCRVTDFGIARAGDDDNQLTKTGAVMGTWGFMAPEQRADAKNVDERADVYAVAATLYALLTNSTPTDLFAAGEDDTMLQGLPSALVPVLRRATEYRKTRRHDSVDAFAADLLAVRDTLPADPLDTPPLVGGAPMDRSAPSEDLIHALTSAASDEVASAPATMAPVAASAVVPQGATLLPPDPEEEAAAAVRGRGAGFDDSRDVRSPMDAAPTTIGRRDDSRLPLWLGGLAAVATLAAGGLVAFAMWGADPEVVATDAAPIPPLVVQPLAIEPVEGGTPAQASAPTVTEAAPAGRTSSSAPAAAPSPAPTPAPSPAPSAAAPAPAAPAAAAPVAQPKPAAVAAAPPKSAAQCIRSASATTSPNKDKIIVRVETCLGTGAPVKAHFRTGGGGWVTQDMRFAVGKHMATFRSANGFDGPVDWYVESKGVRHGSASAPKVFTP